MEVVHRAQVPDGEVASGEKRLPGAAVEPARSPVCRLDGVAGVQENRVVFDHRRSGLIQCEWSVRAQEWGTVSRVDVQREACPGLRIRLGYRGEMIEVGERGQIGRAHV